MARQQETRATICRTDTWTFVEGTIRAGTRTGHLPFGRFDSRRNFKQRKSLQYEFAFRPIGQANRPLSKDTSFRCRSSERRILARVANPRAWGIARSGQNRARGYGFNCVLRRSLSRALPKISRARCRVDLRAVGIYRLYRRSALGNIVTRAGNRKPGLYYCAGSIRENRKQLRNSRPFNDH